MGRTKGGSASSLLTHPFIDFSVLQLDKASADSSYVALLIREGDPPRSLGVLQLRIGVDAGVANATIEAVHDHGKLHWEGEKRSLLDKHHGPPHAHVHTRAHTQRRPAAQLRFIGSKVGFSVHRLRKESIYFPFWPFQHQFSFCKMVNTSTKWTRDTSHKDGLPGVQRLRSIHHKITVVQVPGADLDLSHMHIKTQVLAAHTIYS